MDLAATSRPLVIFAGQGLSIADGFDLTSDVYKAEPECFRYAATPFDLDRVIASLHEGDEATAAEREHLRRRFERSVFELSRPAVLAAKRLRTTQWLCRRLAVLAKQRLVVVFTSNVDCALRVESVKRGAQWLFGRGLVGASSLDAVQRWFEVIERRQPGLHYIPLNGEADLGSTGDGGTWFATQPEFRNWCPAGQPWFSTLAEGVGPRARLIHRRFSVSRDGYDLMTRLLDGGPEDGHLGHDPAELLLVGCGAGSTDFRLEYPLEMHIEQVRRRGRELGRWTAVARWREDHEGERRSRAWLSERRFELLPVDPGGGAPTCQDRLAEVLGW